MRAKRGTWISVAAVLGALALIAGVAVTTIHGRKRASSQGASRSRRTAESSGAWNLFVLDIRKRAPVRLTRNEEEEFTLDPAWQPGPKIAYSQANCEGLAGPVAKRPECQAPAEVGGDREEEGGNCR